MLKPWARKSKESAQHRLCAPKTFETAVFSTKTSLEHTSTGQRLRLCCAHRKHCTSAMFSKLHLTTPRKTQQKRCSFNYAHRNYCTGAVFGTGSIDHTSNTLHRRRVLDKLARPYWAHRKHCTGAVFSTSSLDHTSKQKHGY